MFSVEIYGDEREKVGDRPRLVGSAIDWEVQVVVCAYDTGHTYLGLAGVSGNGQLMFFECFPMACNRSFCSPLIKMLLLS